jgi:hypothetical protein
MKLPTADSYIPFETGGVGLTKAPTQVYLTFYTKQNRIVIEAPVPYYVLEGINDNDSVDMIFNAWDTACTFCKETMLSRPDPEKSKEITTAVRELLGLSLEE